jgi:hypothetical protein
MSNDVGSDPQQQYADAFVRAFAERRWKSQRGLFHWIDTEASQTALAGPLHAVKETGGCAYVYTRDDECFRGVDGPTALRERLRRWHGEMVAVIDAFVPASPDEAADLAAMRKIAADIWAVAETACAIEGDRLKKARG